MKLLALFLVVYVSPGCLSQCVNCAPQPTYQYVLNVPSNYVQVPTTSNRSPCCVPASNVQTIQSARAFTNGAQGSQVIMYYNGQRVVSGGQQPQQQQQGSNFNQANNYQNPGPIPGYQTGYDQNQNQNQTGYYPSNLNGGVVAGGATTGTVVIGGTVTQQGNPNVNVGGNVNNQNINAGGNINDPNQNQYQNADPYQNQQNINAGGVVGNQNQNQFQNQNQYGNQGQYQDQNQYQNQGGFDGNQNQNQDQYQNQDMNAGGYVGDQNQGQYQDQNQYQNQGSTLSPSGGEVGYQPFVPSGNTDYNNGAQGQFDPSQQGQQGQQGQYQQNQNDQQVIYPAGGVAGGAVAGGAVAGSSYNSPNSGYVNSQVQPQTYPTQTVTGGAINNQNVQQQPDMNTQYQDQMNQQNQQNMGQQGNNFQGNQQQGNQQQGNNFQGNPQQGNQGGFVGSASSTTPQGQQFTTAPNNQQFQQSTQQGQFNNQQQNPQGGVFTGNTGFSSTTPGYQQQQGDYLTEGSGNEENEFLGGQQQFTSSPAQQNFNDGQQGYTDNTLTPPVENVQNDNSQFTQAPSSPTPYPVIYPVPGAGQQTQQPQQTQTQAQQFQQNQAQTQPTQQFQPGQTQPTFGTTTPTPYPVIYPVPSAGQETQAPFQASTVSSNQDEFGVQSQNDQAAFETTTQTPTFVPVPVPISQNNNGNVPLESSTTTVPVQSGTQQVTGSTQPGQFNNGGVQGSTNSFQSTTPTTTNNFNNGQSSTGFQSTTGFPVTNDQSGFIASSTMDPNMPQAQYPSQQEILAATGQQADQSATSGANMVSTQAPQFPSQQELGATLQSTQPTPAPQFPAQQNLGVTTQNNQNFNGQQQNGFSSTQASAGAAAQFPSQQELLQRDQQNSGGATGQINNNAGFTPQYGDMNTQYGRYASSTPAVKAASSNPQFDQPTADQQQPQNSAVSSLNVFFVTMLMIFLW